MGHKEKDCAYWVAVLLAGLALGIVGGLAIAGIAYPIYQSDKWAAWVQAFGSIGAIAVAIYIMQGNNKSQRRRDRELALKSLASQEEFLIRSLDTLAGVKGVIEKFEKTSKAGEHLPLVAIRVTIETPLFELRKIPLYEYPYQLLSLSVGNTIISLESALERFSTVNFPSGQITSNDVITALMYADTYVDSYKENIKKLDDEAKNALSFIDALHKKQP